MTVVATRSRRLRSLATGTFQVGQLAYSGSIWQGGGKSGETVRTYTEVVRWFATAHHVRQTRHRDGSRCVSRISRAG